MDIKKYLGNIGFVFMLVLFLGNIGYSTSYMSVVLDNDDIYANEGLDVKVIYDFPDNELYDVKLYFYIDGNLKKIESFEAVSGTYNRFHVDTKYLEKGEHELRIRIKVYADEILESSVIKDFEVWEYNYPYWVNEIETHSDNKVSVVFDIDNNLVIEEGNNAAFDLRFKTSSDEVHKILMKYYVDGMYKGKEYRYFYDGDEKSYILELNDVPIGRHTLKIEVYVYKNNEFITKISKYVDLKVKEKSSYFVVYSLSNYQENVYSYSMYSDGLSYSVSLNVNDKVSLGEPALVYGYTKTNGVKNSGLVKIYVNGKYVKEVMSDSSGYYNAYIEFDKKGYNIVEVYYNGINRGKKVYVEGKNQGNSNKNEDSTNVGNIEGSYTLIVVKDGKVERLYINKEGNVEEKKQDVDEEDVNYEYVDVVVSTKQLTMSKYKGNVLDVYVLNHMNGSKVFSVDTNLNPKWVYTSESLTIKRGERGHLNVYFKPLTDKRGKYEAVVYVKMNGKIIKEIPIELFIAGPMSDKDFVKEEGFEWNMLIWVLLGLFLLFLIIVAGVYFRKEKKENNEEKDIVQETKEKLEGITLLNGDFVRVPENRLIR